MQKLTRRGFELGLAPSLSPKLNNSPGSKLNDGSARWRQGRAVQLHSVCSQFIAEQVNNIAHTERLVMAILDGESADDVLQQSPFHSRLVKRFEPLGAAYNEGDDQEIETLLFDANAAYTETAEDLWMKISWLSFHDEDASIRFRFSFGTDLSEDVAADPVRQRAAAELADAVFPESSVITDNRILHAQIKATTSISTPQFVERIVYFNAPNGGAYLHHDRERGHAGVVYAQISGSTLWLALSQSTLVNEIIGYIEQTELPASLPLEQRQQLTQLVTSPDAVSDALNTFAHSALIHLINETSDFVQHLIKQGHYHVLQPGDVILLPQKNADMCCWHSVFCLGEEMGQALSFAIR